MVSYATSNDGFEAILTLLTLQDPDPKVLAGNKMYKYLNCAPERSRRWESRAAAPAHHKDRCPMLQLPALHLYGWMEKGILGLLPHRLSQQ